VKRRKEGGTADTLGRGLAGRVPGAPALAPAGGSARLAGASLPGESVGGAVSPSPAQGIEHRTDPCAGLAVRWSDEALACAIEERDQLRDLAAALVRLAREAPEWIALRRRQVRELAEGRFELELGGVPLELLEALVREQVLMRVREGA